VDPADPNDPIRTIAWPDPEELEADPGALEDPVGEDGKRVHRLVIQKHHDRALLLVTSRCHFYCRFCFRAGSGREPRPEELEEAVGRMAQIDGLEEVILSGGDPLMLPDERLSAMVRDVASLSHLRRLRIHTRMPIVLPERVDETLVGWLSEIEIPLVMVVHANHPNEIDHDVRRGLAVLASTGVTLLNQTVLLAGVNDDAHVLADLSESLFESKVLPYYLHMLDPVAGAAHFEVANDRALDIMAGLRNRLPGYLVPRLVREIPGAPSKIPVERQE